MKRTLILLPLLFLYSCASVDSSVPAAARAELAPTGKLRVGLIAVSPLYVKTDAPPGVTRGMAVEIAQQLAERLAVPVQPLRYPHVTALAEAARRGEWDVAFLPIDAERAAAMNFTAPYMYFNEAPIGMAVLKQRPAGFAYVFEFIEQMKASGAIQEAVSREALTGVRAAR